MRAFNLNFQQSKLPNRWLGYALLGLGLAALISCYVRYIGLTTKLTNIESEIEQLSHTKPVKLRPADRMQQDVQKHQSELQNKIHQSLAMPWPALFQALETTKPEQMRLSEILPDTATNTIKISGQANQLVDVLAYVQMLKAESIFINVSLLDHQVIKSDARAVVNFEIEALWNQP